VTQQASGRWRLWMVVLVALSMACTRSGKAQSALSPKASQTPLLSGPCPVTEPVPPELVPKTVVRVISAGYEGPPSGLTFEHWYGKEALWVALPLGGKIVTPPGEKLGDKFMWVRLHRGFLTIEGRRLDGPAPLAEGLVPSGYGISGFQASAVAFPTEGCWEITGKMGRHELSFVVEVRRGSG
jgi:hypothetical protein